MIDASVVTDVVLARLRESWAYVGDGRAPAGAQGAYAVLEVEPGGISDGDMAQPERDFHVRYRVTSVSRDDTGAASADGARAQAEHIAWRMRKAMLDRTVPIADVDWAVKGRTHVGTSGTMRGGTTVNVADDFELWVVAV